MPASGWGVFFQNLEMVAEFFRINASIAFLVKTTDDLTRLESA